MITCAPPPTPTPYQLLGKCFIGLSSQLTCLPAARSPGLGGSSWDTQTDPLLPWRGLTRPHGPSGQTGSAKNAKSPLPATKPGRSAQQRVPKQQAVCPEIGKGTGTVQLGARASLTLHGCACGVCTRRSGSKISINRSQLSPPIEATFLPEVHQISIIPALKLNCDFCLLGQFGCLQPR